MQRSVICALLYNVHVLYLLLSIDYLSLGVSEHVKSFSFIIGFKANED